MSRYPNRTNRRSKCRFVGSFDCRFEFFVTLFSGQLFGCFDGILDCTLAGFSVDHHLAFILATACAPLMDNAHNLEGDLLVLLLTPIDQLAFIIPVSMGQGLNIHVATNDAIDDDPLSKLVTLFEIDSADQSLKGVSIHRFENALRFAIVLDKMRKAYFLSQLVETGTGYNLRTHLSKKTLTLIGVLLIEEICHDSAKDRIAQIFQSLIVDFAPVGSFLRFGLMNKGNLIKLRMAGDETENVLKKAVKVFVLTITLAKTPHYSKSSILKFLKSQADIVSTEAKSIAEGKMDITFTSLIESKVQRFD